MENNKKTIKGIHPTISVCGKQKKEILDLNTTSKLEVSDSRNSCKGRVSNGRLQTMQNRDKSELLKKHSITGYGTRKYYQGKHIGGSIRIPCPFCLRSNIIKNSIRNNNQTNEKVKSYKCLNCGKCFSDSKYYNVHTPPYIMDWFIEFIENGQIYVTPNKDIPQIIKDKFNYSIHKGTICAWLKKYNKGRLYSYYIPNSKLNSINKPKIKYIPKTQDEIRIKCRFCGHPYASKSGTLYTKLYGHTQRYRCKSCNKRFVYNPYNDKINNFIVEHHKKGESVREIAELYFNKFKKKIHRATIHKRLMKWNKYERKFDLSRALKLLKDYNGQTVKAKTIGKIWGYNHKSPHIDRCTLLTKGYVEKLDNGLYYINYDGGELSPSAEGRLISVKRETSKVSPNFPHIHNKNASEENSS